MNKTVFASVTAAGLTALVGIAVVMSIVSLLMNYGA